MPNPKIAQNIVIRAYPNSDYFLVMNTKNGEVYQTNETGKKILELCDGKKTVEEIIKELCPSKEAEKEVKEYFDELRKAGAITLKS